MSYKKEEEVYLIFFVLPILLLFFYLIGNVRADNYENSTINVSVYVREPIARIEISPSSIDFGEITKGYFTNFTNISVVNTGDIDLRIQPVLPEGANPIFQNIRFSTASCTQWLSSNVIGNWTSANISRAAEYRGAGTRYNFCMRLDLRNYEQEIPNDLNLSTQLIIWVIPA